MSFEKELQNLRQAAKTWTERALLTQILELWQKSQQEQKTTLRHAQDWLYKAKNGVDICLN